MLNYQLNRVKWNVESNDISASELNEYTKERKNQANKKDKWKEAISDRKQYLWSILHVDMLCLFCFVCFGFLCFLFVFVLDYG